MGLLTDSATWLTDRMEEAAGQDVTYTRGAESITLTAWPGQALFAVSAPVDKARVVWGDADWLFDASQLVIGGRTVVPRRGDRITATLAGESCVFEVSTPTGEKEWRFSDDTRTRIRAHTKRVA